MRWNRIIARRRVAGQHGFTLLELLVVIAVLGALSGVAVASISTVRTKATESACAADATTLETAESAALVRGGAHLAEDELVSAGYLDSASTKHDIVLVADGYQLVPVGECAGGGEELADGADGEPGDEAAADDAAAKAAAEAEQKAKEDAAAKEKADADAKAKAEAEQAKLDEEAAAKAAAEAEQKAKEEAAAKEKAEAEEKEKAEQEAAGKGCRRGQIDINTASKRDLTRIDHVGGDEATRITKQRPFASLQQLTEVKGLDDKDVADIIEQGLACVG